MSAPQLATTLPPPSFRPAGPKPTTQRPLHASSTAPRRRMVQIESGGNSFVYESRVTQVLQGEKVLLPLKVQIRVSPDYVSVTDLNTGIAGVGQTETEAKKDFQQALIDYRDVLASEENLSIELRALLSYLVSIS